MQGICKACVISDPAVGALGAAPELQEECEGRAEHEERCPDGHYINKNGSCRRKPACPHGQAKLERRKIY